MIATTFVSHLFSDFVFLKYFCFISAELSTKINTKKMSGIVVPTAKTVGNKIPPVVWMPNGTRRPKNNHTNVGQKASANATPKPNDPKGDPSGILLFNHSLNFTPNVGRNLISPKKYNPAMIISGPIVFLIRTINEVFPFTVISCTPK